MGNNKLVGSALLLLSAVVAAAGALSGRVHIEDDGPVPSSNTVKMHHKAVVSYARLLADIREGVANECARGRIETAKQYHDFIQERREAAEKAAFEDCAAGEHEYLGGLDSDGDPKFTPERASVWAREAAEGFRKVQ